MAYSEKLAARMREVLATQKKKVEEKPMMGGLTFMVNGKMCVGIIGDEMMARIAPEMHETAVEKDGCREMDFTGRPMRGYVMIDESGMGTRRQLEVWINLAIDFNDKAKASKKKATAAPQSKTKKKAPAEKIAKVKTKAKKKAVVRRK